MATAIPFHGAELDRAMRKLAADEPLTPREGALVHRKVDGLTRADLDSILRAFDEAPLGEPLSPEEEAECAERDEELRSGRVEGVRHDQVRRRLDEARDPASD
jgi:hypothetical protein